ncbi:MAG: FtsX-like permease family protein, partial [Eggerthellaceae bacterium]|nr:FtsX-like permease family protein [Eggerthellaceae bacterium]
MVEDDRGLIGTYKALGYSRLSIAFKYMFYIFVACILGGLIGCSLLCVFLPWFTQFAYQIIYTIPYYAPPLMPLQIAVSIALMLLIVSITTYFSLHATLNESPITLLHRKVGKVGKKIVLERLSIIWNRLSFLWKIILRNTFLFKKRLIMTVIGIMGCTALILAGFGLNDGINDIIDLQYGNITLDNAFSSLNLKDINAEEKQQVLSFYDNPEYFSDNALISETAFKINTEKDGDVVVYLDVPDNSENFLNNYDLHNPKTKQKLELGDNDVIINEKLASLLNVKEGDEFQIYLLDALGNITDKPIKLKCTEICEYYINNYVFAGKQAIQEAYQPYPNKSIDYNMMLSKVPNDTELRNQLSEKAQNIPGINSISYNDEAIDNYRELLKSVSMVDILLIVSAAALAFIVLYNLININITERVREIATFKVLGFYNRELRSYIFREVILLSIFGAFLGLFAGIFLTRFVVKSAELSMV